MNEARPYASLSSGLLARKGSAKPAMRPQSFGNIEDLGWNDMGYGPGEGPQPASAPEHVPSSIAALTPAPKMMRTAPSGEDRLEDRDGAEPFEAAAPEPAEEETAGFDAPAHIEAEQVEAEAFETPEPKAFETPEPEAFEAPEPEAFYAPEPEEYEAPPVVTQHRALRERFEGEAEAEATFAPATPKRAAHAEIVPMPQRRPVVAGGHKAAFTLRLDAERHLRLRLACAVTGHSAQQIVARALEEALADIPEIEALASQVPSKGRAGAKRN